MEALWAEREHLLLGLAVGLLQGTVGVGGGVLVTTYMSIASDMEVHRICATALLAGLVRALPVYLVFFILFALDSRFMEHVCYTTCRPRAHTTVKRLFSQHSANKGTCIHTRVVFFFLQSARDETFIFSVKPETKLLFSES